MIEAVAKATSRVAEAIGSPVLIALIVICAGLLGAVMYLWDRQSERNQIAFINLVEECVPNNREKE